MTIHLFQTLDAILYGKQLVDYICCHEITTPVLTDISERPVHSKRQKSHMTAHRICICFRTTYENLRSDLKNIKFVHSESVQFFKSKKLELRHFRLVMWMEPFMLWMSGCTTSQRCWIGLRCGNWDGWWMVFWNMSFLFGLCTPLYINTEDIQPLNKHVWNYMVNTRYSPGMVFNSQRCLVKR